MSVLTPSNLETIDYGTQGWNAIVTSDMQRINDKLGHLMSAAKISGTATLANNAATVTNPAAQTSETLTDSSTGTASQTIGDVGSSFDQATLNSVHASLVDEINKLRADIAESRTREAEYKTAIESLKTSHNALLAELRKTTGNGVLGG